MKIKENPYYGKPGVSNSSMKLINPEEGGSPKLYKAVLAGVMEKNQSLSLENGKLVHLFALQPDEFKVADVEKPTEGLVKVMDNLIKLGNPLVGFDKSELVAAARRVGYRSNWGIDAVLKELDTPVMKSYYEYLKLPEEFVIINSREKSIIDNSIQSIKQHQLANYFIFGNEWDGLEVYNEFEITAQDPISGLLVKGLIDKIAIHHDKKIIYVPDLKTTSKPVSNFEHSYRWYRYYRQHAVYIDLIKFHFKDLIDAGYTVIPKSVVVNISNGLFEVRVFSIDDSYIQFGRNEYQGLLHRIAFHDFHGWDYSLEEYQNKLDGFELETKIYFKPNLHEQ